VHEPVDLRALSPVERKWRLTSLTEYKNKYQQKYKTNSRLAQFNFSNQKVVGLRSSNQFNSKELEHLVKDEPHKHQDYTQKHFFFQIKKTKVEQISVQ
jgi:uncharacterized protein YhbP (UPF0306 family)